MTVSMILLSSTVLAACNYIIVNIVVSLQRFLTSKYLLILVKFDKHSAHRISATRVKPHTDFIRILKNVFIRFSETHPQTSSNV